MCWCPTTRSWLAAGEGPPAGPSQAQPQSRCWSLRRRLPCPPTCLPVRLTPHAHLVCPSPSLRCPAWWCCSHLPDITVITPVWEGGRVVFFVASRGHHAGGWHAAVWKPPMRPALLPSLCSDCSLVCVFVSVCIGTVFAHALLEWSGRKQAYTVTPSLLLPACRHWRHLPRQHAAPLAQPGRGGGRHHLA